MRRGRALKRGRWLSLLAAGVVGYLLGDWHAAAVRSLDLSPSQNVALRFPEMSSDAAIADAADMPAGTTNAMVLGDVRVALLSPEPMVPRPAPQVAAVSPSAETAPTHRAVPAVPTAARPRTMAQPVAAMQPAAEPRLASGAPRQAGRPGFLLNDAQIASIKRRLHLTVDQERMWPAVEAALRNMAYAKARGGYRRDMDGNAQVASLDPDSVEVRGLKSAAIPLIMSFSDEQKNEVRSLAHVMGLDRLASEL